jgi:hypothetical protein
MQTCELTGLTKIVAGLTDLERQLAIANLGLLAACGMAVAGRNGQLSPWFVLVGICFAWWPRAAI